MRENLAPESERRQPRSAGQTKAGLSGFARRVLPEWKRLGLPLRHERVVVAVSGGADSVALLLVLDELMKAGRFDLRLTVAHLDHGLRGEAGAEDARWVARLAGELGVEAEAERVDVLGLAAKTGDNLEQAARRARYEFLLWVAEKREARAVLTGHTLDDQAETVLLRLLRGSGAEGLGGMEAVRVLAEGAEVKLARPFIGWARRAETEEYCRRRNVEFRADEMNEDEKFARVRVRRKLLPLMESFNPEVVRTLGRTAQLLREDASVLNAAAEELLVAATLEEGGDLASEEKTSGARPLRVNILSGAPAALRRRALRLWLERCRGDLRRLELVHLRGVEKLLVGERGGRVAELPGGGRVERRRGRLLFQMK